VFSYELRECGRTVWGDPDDLLRIPAIASSGILREDAWRLLCNRMVEVMEMAVTSPPRNRFLSVAFRYRVIKLFLDMATSYLVFIGEYAPSYRKRQEAISRMEHCDNRADIPFDVARFRRMVETCTAWKLDCHCPRLSWDEWMYAVDTAHSLWRWETALLCNTDPTAPDETLMRRCMKRQPMAGRVRGWLYVLRCRGWLRSWNHWARWATMACLASPRYWTYAAATALFFRLPELMEADTNADLPGPRQPELPLHVARTPLRGWRAKAEEIALNYHTLLEKTRT
jgi:hypothetical protein